ncbi:DJ-1/PfpI family protein [Actinomyces viscosus]|uniref:DJ-1/PfpI family protein n=1 Tax=Actinomyces viscosus TaxID=1656 RepID=A0ABT7TXM6_ACTVI|nr:DJ-1/PfpI family protein [Actinomyces viscosus]MDM8075903.1 DJ-1/PfpI family protein [Actinomyces viscosus]
MHNTIALYTTETMTDWEYAYLTTQIAGAEQLKPGRFRLLLVGDGLESVRTLGNLPLTPEADLDTLQALADDGSLAALVIPGGDHYEAGHDQLIEAVGRLVDEEIPVAAICGATLLLARSGFLDERRHTSNAAPYLEASGYRGGTHYAETPVVTDRGVTTASGIHAIPFTAEVMRITGLVPDAMTHTWEQVFLSAWEDDYMALMEATSAWQNS